MADVSCEGLTQMALGFVTGIAIVIVVGLMVLGAITVVDWWRYR